MSPTIKLGPSDHQKIAHTLMGEEQLADPTWSDQGNAPYKLPVFPICTDTSTIIACKQCEGETVDDYCARLLVAFNQHSRQAGMWDSHLRQYFDNDLLPHIADMIRKMCEIGQTL